MQAPSNFESFVSIIKRQSQLRKKLPVLLALMSVFVTFNVTEPYFYKLFVDAVEAVLSGKVSREEGVRTFAVYAVTWGALILASVGSAYAYNYRLWTTGNLEWNRSTRDLLKTFFRLPYDYHVSTDVGEKVRVSQRGPEAEFHIVERFFMVIVPQSVIFVGFFILGFAVNPVMMGVVLAFIPLLGIVSFTVGKKAHEKQKAANDFWDAASGRFSDALQNIRVIRLFVREPKESQTIASLNERAIDHQYSINKLWGLLEAGRQFLEFLVKVTVMIVGAFLVMHGKISLGELFLFVALSGRFYGPLQSIESAYRDIVTKLADMKKSESLHAMEGENDSGTLPFSGIGKEGIVFKGVGFHYPSNDRKVLQGLDIEIKKGSRVALVGHTGSGKSTIANLLLRFYEATSGTVTAAGRDVREYSLASYRRKFAAVFQDTTLFNDTILANLEYVRDGLSRTDIERACRDAEILDFIESLPEGFETVVGERGLKLSGGEKQRVSIARAILSDPEVLVLDEATSALDSRTELRVQKAFDRLMEGRTSLVIAHRLSTVIGSDRIYVLDGGRVSGLGTHTELYDSNALYRELVDAQKDGFFSDEKLSVSS